MSKKGMKRYTHTKPHNEQAAVPELQGKQKHTNTKANPIIAGTHAPSLKVYHSVAHSAQRPIADIYKEIDNDLARDNLENDATAADYNELQ